jgi:hypothetical protein
MDEKHRRGRILTFKQFMTLPKHAATTSRKSKARRPSKVSIAQHHANVIKNALLEKQRRPNRKNRRNTPSKNAYNTRQSVDEPTVASGHSGLSNPVEREIEGQTMIPER